MNEDKQVMKKREWIGLIIGTLGIFASCFLVRIINQAIVAGLSIAPRMICLILTYWICLIVPVIIFIIQKDSVYEYGFEKENRTGQIVTGVVIAVIMSVILTLVPHLLGFGDYVDNGNRYEYWWQFVFEFIYCIGAVAAVEEMAFRGFLYTKIKRVSESETAAIIISSVLFGLFHFLSGQVLQMILTAILGVLFCIIRKKIRSCSTLSLIICHGIYDALITVWASIFKP